MFTDRVPERAAADAEKGILPSTIDVSSPRFDTPHSKFGTPDSRGFATGSRFRTARRQITRILTPSFLSPNQNAHKPRPTDFLDGMRGYAAFAVFCCHFIMPTHPKAHMGYGGNNGKDDYWITQLPIIRLIYSGHVCVCLFFIISGFSISLKPLDLARKGQFSMLSDTLVSGTFRRPFRLYIPCLITFTITLIMSWIGAFHFSFLLTTTKWPFPSRPLKIPFEHPTIGAQLQDFIWQIMIWSDPLATGRKGPLHPTYGTQLWTIPVELKCSLVVFLVLLGLPKLRPKLRMIFTGLLGVYFQLARHPEITLFLIGAILAELHLERTERAARSPTSPLPESTMQKCKAAALFILGLFLASYPPWGADKALLWGPFHKLASLIVGGNADADLNFWQTIANTILVLTVNKSPWLQQLFIAPAGIYLGKISFAFYCVHQALINWFGYRTILIFWSFTGNKTLFEYESGIMLSWVTQSVATIFIADIYWRYVDAPSVGWTRAIEKWCVGDR